MEAYAHTKIVSEQVEGGERHSVHLQVASEDGYNTIAKVVVFDKELADSIAAFYRANKDGVLSIICNME